jgi:hypothetical protein
VRVALVIVVSITLVSACARDPGSWRRARDRLCDNIGVARAQIASRLELERLGHIPQLVDAELPPAPDPGSRRIQLVQRSLQQCREIVARWLWVDGALFGFKTAAVAIDLGRPEGAVELSTTLPMAIDFPAGRSEFDPLHLGPASCDITCSATDCDDWAKAFDDRIVAPLRAVAARIDGGFAAALAACKR